MEAIERNQQEESIDNERYELVNVDMKGGLVRGRGPQLRKTHEDLMGEPLLQEQEEAEASHGDVAGVRFTHKVGAPWYEETDRVMPNQFG